MHPLARAEVQAVHVPAVTGTASQQVVPSLSASVPCWFAGQTEQDVPASNGVFSGSDMNEPDGQQPYRAVLAVTPEPRLVKAFLVASVKDSHAPPHNVRLNPLSLKTETKETDQCMRRRNNTICGWWVRFIFLGIFSKIFLFWKRKQHREEYTYCFA